MAPYYQRIDVLINAGAGKQNAAAVENVTDAFRAAGVDARVALTEGAAIAREAAEAVRRGSSLIVAAGGDGSVSAAASAVAGTDAALGVIPLGTLNHFAKDLGIPLALDDAARTIVEGKTTRVDVGEVNGRVFVNNSSLGLYPEIVRDRERQQRRLGRGKWPALAWASWTALRRYAFMHVTLRIDGVERSLRTPFVFVGNNEYLMEGFSIGERGGSLCDGRLSVYVVHRPGRLRLLVLALRALVGRLRQAGDFEALLTTDVVIDSHHRTLRVATDGEISTMQTPLRYRIRPACLRVAVPAGA